MTDEAAMTPEVLDRITEMYCDANMKCDDDTGLYDVQPGCETRKAAAKVWLTVCGVGLLLDEVQRLTTENARLLTTENARLLTLNAAVAAENLRLREAGNTMASALEELGGIGAWFINPETNKETYIAGCHPRCRAAEAGADQWRVLAARQQPPAAEGESVALERDRE